MRLPASSRSGFTLAEVAVTIAIVAISLTLSMQILNGATITAANTRNQKIARELGLYTLGQIESGLYWEDVENGFGGTYADLDRPEYSFEVVLGDDAFMDEVDSYDPDRPFDNWAYQREREMDSDDYDEEAAQPFEKVKIRVTYPPLREFPNTVDLERWIPWEQVYGPEAAEDGDLPPGDATGGGEEFED